MTFPHTPRLRFSLLSALIGTAVNISVLYIPSDWSIGWLFATGFFCYILAVIEVCLVVIAAHNDRMQVETSRIQAIAQCPADRLNALGYVMPELGLHIVASLPVVLWEGVTDLEIFRKFLMACRDDYIAPIRDWGKSVEEQDAYALILDKLLELGYVYSRAEGGSPSGPKSWLFRPGALPRLWAEWMGWNVVFQGVKELQND
jgi:hypothetical protein